MEVHANGTHTQSLIVCFCVCQLICDNWMFSSENENENQFLPCSAQDVKQYLDLSNKLQGDPPGFGYEVIHLQVGTSFGVAFNHLGMP